MGSGCAGDLMAPERTALALDAGAVPAEAPGAKQNKVSSVLQSPKTVGSNGKARGRRTRVAALQAVGRGARSS